MLKDLNHPTATYLTKLPSKELQTRLINQLKKEEPHMSETLDTLNMYIDKHQWAKKADKEQTKEYLTIIIDVILDHL